VVVRSGLTFGRTVEKTLALEADVSCLRHHVSVLSRQLHLSALESESLRRELDALRLVAPLSREGDGEASPVREEVADVVAVHALVAVPGVSTVASFVAHEEAFLVNTMTSPFGAQKPEPVVAEPKLPVVVQVEQSPSADRAIGRRNLRNVRWVDDEGGVASRKPEAQVVEVIVAWSPPPVPPPSNVFLVTSVAGEGGSDHYAHDPGSITISPGRRRKASGGRH